MSAHTPGPWRVDRDGAIIAGKARRIVVGSPADMDAGATGLWPSKADAARIVACVNACEGAALSELSPGTWIANDAAARQGLAQRDELAAALEMSRLWVSDTDEHAPGKVGPCACYRCKFIQARRAALANVVVRKVPS